MAEQTIATELRTAPLSAINVREGWNPRNDVERAELAQLTASVREHGVIHPLVVTPHGDGYDLIDGERRYRACIDAAVMEVPIVVRAADEDTGGLDVALVANMSRVDLNPVEEAHGFKRLMDEAGLTRKGAAERLSVTQARIRERLQILDLSEDLWPKVADGSIPISAVKPLAKLAQVHPGLPGLAVTNVLASPAGDGYWDEEPWTWGDVTSDALRVALGDDETLPSDVFRVYATYPVERFTLGEKAESDRAKLGELLGGEITSLRFERFAFELAEPLGEAHGDGSCAVIVGQDVADQIASDIIAKALKEERARRRAARSNGEGAAAHEADGSDSGRGPADEEAARQRRREERKALEEARRAATAFNLDLGAAVCKHLARVKVDERVLRILAAFDLAGELDRIAMRGARYGFPGWYDTEERRDGTTKYVYLDRAGSTDRARSWLANGKGMGDVAGRQIALLVMARFADEDAVAQSARSFASLSPGRHLPWSGEVFQLLDELAAERLPDHLLEPSREAREEQAAAARAANEHAAWYAEQCAALEGISADQREQVLAETIDRFGDWSAKAHDVRTRIERLGAEVGSDEEGGAS